MTGPQPRGVPAMRQVQIRRTTKQTIKAKTRRDEDDLDLRTPSGRLLAF
jgi:hypothetical protein